MKYGTIFIIVLMLISGCGKEAVKDEPTPESKPELEAKQEQAEKKTAAEEVKIHTGKAPISQEEPDMAIFSIQPAITPPPSTLAERYRKAPVKPSAAKTVRTEEKPAKEKIKKEPPPKKPEQPAKLAEDADSVDVLYMVRPNDYLGKISNKEYGTYAMWKKIWKWNRTLIGDNPHLIYPFNEFTLKKPPEMANEVKYDFYDYTVKPSESLWVIAKKVYGNHLAWIIILQDNFDSIGSRHDLIPAGTVLKLRTRLY